MSSWAVTKTHVCATMWLHSCVVAQISNRKKHRI
nr:MAG TPA: hypothetical protein [Caudoviricetes sp.]